VNAPSWGNLESLDLSGWVLDDNLENLLRCPHLAQLKRLDLNGTQFQNRHVEAIANSPFLAGLTQLHIGEGTGRNGSFGDDAYVALASSPYLRHLRTLELMGGCYSTEVGIRALVQSPVVSKVRSLGIQTTDAGLHALVGASQLDNLNRLFVRLHEVGSGDGLNALTCSSRLPHLSFIRCFGSDIPEQIQGALLQSRKLAWPGIVPYHTESPTLRALFCQRFDRDYSIDFGTDFETTHPFFPWWD
jgi:hypothetical protein